MKQKLLAWLKPDKSELLELFREARLVTKLWVSVRRWTLGFDLFTLRAIAALG